jgi:sugar lactone lactonase YvrE
MDEPVESVVVERELPLDVGQMHGVTWDGEMVWCVDGAIPRLLRVDPKSGKITRELTGIPADAGTAFDGRDLWQIGGDRARQISLEDGRVQRELALPDDGVSGLSWTDGIFWVGNHRGKHILKIDATSGAVLTKLESDCHVCGVTWAGGELWHCAWTTRFPTSEGWAELRRVDPSSGAVLRRLRFPEWIAGIEADSEGRLWCATDSASKLLCIRHPGAPRV